MMKRQVIFVAVLLLFGALCSASSNKDEIKNLPGLTSQLPFKQYGGYFDLPGTKKHMYYWFVEVANVDPKTKPLLIWMNGGPGCSSLTGLMTENGPIEFQDGSTPVVNPNSWNDLASVLYVDAPAGVGFSYSEDKSDYHIGDDQMALDMLSTLNEFFSRYPDMAKVPLYIAGESYGGHYVPELVDIILKKSPSIAANLKGFAVGNPLSKSEIDFNYQYHYYYSHAMVDPETYFQAVDVCQNDFWNATDPKCVALMNKMKSEATGIDFYEILEDLCLEEEPVNRRVRHLHEGRPLSLIPESPCAVNYMTDYLRKNDVMTAIHADTSIVYDVCSSIVVYSQDDFDRSMLPLYKNFVMRYNLSILVYSGDLDSILPFMGTQAWIKELDFPTMQSWTGWKASDSQVAGYATKYDGLTFTTIRGAGHMVPGTQPLRGHDMIENWFTGEL